jgi:hypothetical protein
MGRSGGFAPSGDGLWVNGAGDLAPAGRQDVWRGGAIGELLAGTFAALVAAVVVGTMFITTEYRDGLIRTTLTAGSHRGRVLAAKVVVLGSATFLVGLAATAVALPLGEWLARARDVPLIPVTPGDRLRVQVGTAAVLAVCAVLALATGTVLRRGATTVATVIAVTVVPYVATITPILPPAAARWLARVTPVAAFSVQQTLTRFPQVDSVYTPANGYYPLPPWAGFGVLCGYTGLVLVVAVILLRRRDA